MNDARLTVSSSPHIHANYDTSKIMLAVTIALLPAALWGVFSFGLRALLVLAVSTATAMLAEYLMDRLLKKKTLWDNSALLTGLLVGMNMSPNVPLFVPIVASLFAILVVKWTFGGLGANWANPALGGRIFVFYSFTNAMSTFSLPRNLMNRMVVSDALSSATIDSLSSATPLTFLKTRLGQGLAYSDILSHGKYPLTEFARNLGEALHINPYAVDAFFGNQGGCIGETSAFLILVGGIFLLASGIITWHIPVFYLGSFALLNWLFGGFPNGLGFAQGEVLLPLFSGGLFLGAFFMATDYVTSPGTYKGQAIFAVGCGFFTFLFRNFGSMPEAVSVSILLMNIISPTIDRYIKNRKFGEVEPKRKEAKA